MQVYLSNPTNLQTKVSINVFYLLSTKSQTVSLDTRLEKCVESELAGVL